MVKHILVIMVDDLRPELNCFGKRKLVTPNIDRLAARSMRYERAYCNFPQCMPSRASFMTGLRPRKFCSRSNQLVTHGQPTLPALMRRRGLRTLSVGKVYHEPLDDAYHWDELHTDTFRALPWGGMSHFNHDYQLEAHQRQTAVKLSFRVNEFAGHHHTFPPLFECSDAAEENFIDARVAARAIGRLRELQPADKGLFLCVGFQRPHLPWVAPRRYWDLYNRADIDLADNPFFPSNAVGKGDLCDLRHYRDAEVNEKFSDVGRFRDDDFPVLSPDKQRELIHAYWASVSLMDAQVGKLLDELDALGMTDQTAIVLWGDNGYHLGEHKLWSKVTCFDESSRVPLLLSVPGVTDGGSTRQLVESVDVYPTLCRLLDIEPPPHLHGTPLPMSPAEKGRDCVFTVSPTGQTVLTDRYRLTRYPKISAERPHPTVIPGRGEYDLFDHHSDPGENHNVVHLPEHADALRALQARLHAFFGQG